MGNVSESEEEVSEEDELAAFMGFSNHSPKTRSNLRGLLKPLTKTDQWRLALGHSRLPTTTNRDPTAEAEEEMPGEEMPFQNSNLEADSGVPPPRPGHYTQQSSSAPTSPFTSDFDTDKDDKIVKIIDGNKLRDSSTAVSRLALSNSMRRNRFRIRDQPEEDRSLWTLLFLVIKLDVVNKGPDNMSSEVKGIKVTIDTDYEWYNLIKGRYE